MDSKQLSFLVKGSKYLPSKPLQHGPGLISISTQVSFGLFGSGTKCLEDGGPEMSLGAK